MSQKVDASIEQGEGEIVAQSIEISTNNHWYTAAKSTDHRTTEFLQITHR